MTEKKRKSIPSTRSDHKTPFPKHLIFQIVKDIENGTNRKSACLKYGMAYCTLCEWMNKYGSEVYHCSKKRVYPLKDKRAIVRAINEGRTTKKEACISHDIDKKVLNQWIRNFRNQSDELSSSNEVTMIEIKDSLKEEAGKELAQAMLKIKALETMIDIAEEQFKISIRKKFGAKQ